MFKKPTTIIKEGTQQADKTMVATNTKGITMAVITTTEDPTGKTTEIPTANGTTPKDNNMMVTKTDTTETLPPMRTRKSEIFVMASSKTKEEQDR